MTNQEILNQIAKELDWNVSFEDNEIVFQRYSPAEQDFFFKVPNDCLANVILSIEKYRDSFDISYESYIWLDNTGHGKNGAPYDMLDVYNDIKDCYEQIGILQDKLVEAYYNN